MTHLFVDKLHILKLSDTLHNLTTFRQNAWLKKFSHP